MVQTEAQFTTVLEGLRDDFKVVIEGQDILRDKMDVVETRLDGVETRLDGMQTELVSLRHTVDEKVSKKEFNALEDRLVKLEQFVQQKMGV